MRLLLNIILISISILACYIEDIYLYLAPPRSDQAIYLSIRAGRSFKFDQQTELDDKRKTALSEYIPVYHHSSLGVETSVKTFEAFMQTVAAFQEKRKNGVEDLRRQLEKEFGETLSPNKIIQIITYRDLKNLLEGILTIEESILQNKIIRDAQALAGKDTIQIRNANSAGTVTHPVADLMTLEKARSLLEEKVRQLFWQVDKRVLDPVVQISLATLQPNLEYDRKENERRMDIINREFPSQTVLYKPGDVLVPFHKIMSDKDVLLLDAYRKYQHEWLSRNPPLTFFTILFMVGKLYRQVFMI